ncbi:MAG: dNTP triphosphohydrolase [Chitinophagales bacterium]|nr:dNTP triphosphohydrolase [Chitinophagales bacterium]
MNLNQLYSTQRPGKPSLNSDIRTEYQRDFDRLIFSGPFRRLQNKTQVFPLPGSTLVHNRLTHSLEVASIGRSLGKITGRMLVQQFEGVLTEEAKEFYGHHLSEVIAAACLAHDIGNPAFGHSGEKAISHFFLNGGVDKNLFSEAEWKDLTNFEGNANALRLLTHQFNGRLPGGYRLTLTTLATILKYPCEALGSDKSKVHLKKYGFFQTEKELFLKIVNEFGLLQENENPLQYCRHPFVYLLEAADDIAYRIIDFEDAARLGIITVDLMREKVLKLLMELRRDDISEVEETLNMIGDENEKLSYLRSRAINTLTFSAADVFMQNIQVILEGKYQSTLIDEIQLRSDSLKEIEKISIQKIYNHPTVVEIELAGYNVMKELLSTWIPAAIKTKSERTAPESKVMQLIPEQFGPFEESDSPYSKVMRILDVVSGMTDLYATELYRKIKGIDIGKHK